MDYVMDNVIDYNTMNDYYNYISKLKGFKLLKVL